MHLTPMMREGVNDSEDISGKDFSGQCSVYSRQQEGATSPKSAIQSQPERQGWPQGCSLSPGCQVYIPCLFTGPTWKMENQRSFTKGWEEARASVLPPGPLRPGSQACLVGRRRDENFNKALTNRTVHSSQCHEAKCQ